MKNCTRLVQCQLGVTDHWHETDFEVLFIGIGQASKGFQLLEKSFSK